MEKGEKMAEKIYKAAAYMRLPKKADDYMYKESESIESQRNIIESFINGRDDLSLAEEFVDDGYSGTNFDRPGFQGMLEKIRKSEIDCVICKDLSRFGRNYIDCGVYLEKIFPFMGVRFISISEKIDSKNMIYGESVMIPFLDILNEEYSRDISRKIRSSLSAKRRAGDFVGAFAAYGYMKDPENHNKLIVDTEAAETVKYVFRKRIEEFCNQAITAELNQKGVLSSGEYAKAKGIRQRCQWQKRDQLIWDAVTVKRVFENEICGCSNYKKYRRYTLHNINSGKLEAAVFEAICERVNSVKRLQKQLNQYDREQLMRWEIIQLERIVQDCQGEIEVNVKDLKVLDPK